MKTKQTGSITVFMSLMLMVTASLLFTLLEGSRSMMLGMMAMLNSQSVTESTLAEYNIPAYQNYHLFMMDSGFGTGELLLSKINADMQRLGQENLNPTVIGLGRYNNFLQMDVTDSSIVQYELATDRNARPLLRQISELTKGEVAADLIEQAYKKATGIQESCNDGKQTDKYLDGALDTIEQSKETADKASLHYSRNMPLLTNLTVSPQNIRKYSNIRQIKTHNIILLDTPTDPESPSEIPNPMEDIKNAKNSPLLSQILSDEASISAKQLSKEDTIGTRAMNIGNYENPNTSNVVDKLLTIQYLKKYTSNYKNQLHMPHSLEYEQEYILFGKSSDEDNLKKMAGKLLLLREGINFAYLLTDHAKREEALAMATTIASIAAIPAAVTVIQMGLLASWAYAESIAELRTLFSGGNIAAIKSSENWTVNLAEAVSVVFNTSIKSKEVSGGMNYEDYLQAFLTLESMDNIGMRFANLLEKNLRLYPGCEQIKLDCMITAMVTETIYQAQQVFLTFVSIERLSKKGYRYKSKYNFSYSSVEG